MPRVRSIVNAELVAFNPVTTEEKVMQIGAHDYVEANKVEVFSLEGETLANIHLVDGFILEGVLWGPQYFENHGVIEEPINVDREEFGERASEDTGEQE